MNNIQIFSYPVDTIKSQSHFSPNTNTVMLQLKFKHKITIPTIIYCLICAKSYFVSESYSKVYRKAMYINNCFSLIRCSSTDFVVHKVCQKL